MSDSPASDFAVALLDEFVHLGMRDVVLSPGSRSQALALAAAEYERAGRLRLRVRIDERVAGFLALGLAIETRQPVAVITTSGTAVANLHPAVLEAHHAGVPLILLTADRPSELRGIGSNQTTEQPGIFGSAVAANWDITAPTGQSGETDAAARLAQDAYAAARRGPVHLNLAFAEPLSGRVELPRPRKGADPDPAEAQAASSPIQLQTDAATVVIAGAAAGPDAEEAARQLGAPLIAEVSSGARFGPNLVVTYRELLAQPGFGDAVRRAVVFGHPTLSREVPALLERDGVEVIVVRSAGADDYNPGRRVARFADAVRASGPPHPESRDWVGRWVFASRGLLAPEEPGNTTEKSSLKAAAEFTRSALAAMRAPITRRSLAEAVWQASWPHDRLVLAASRLIRDVDRAVPGKRISVHANRGLAGIDGTVSTGIGIALGAGEGAGVTRVLLGDLALLHDAGALLFGEGEPRSRVQLIVGNDGGGTIFDKLEVAATADARSFDRVLTTPQRVDLAALAAAYGWAYRRVETMAELEQALGTTSEPLLIEVPLAR